MVIKCPKCGSRNLNRSVGVTKSADYINGILESYGELTDTDIRWECYVCGHGWNP